jgi:hypothetical protein
MYQTGIPSENPSQIPSMVESITRLEKASYEGNELVASLRELVNRLYPIEPTPINCEAKSDHNCAISLLTRTGDRLFDNNHQLSQIVRHLSTIL